MKIIVDSTILYKTLDVLSPIASKRSHVRIVAKDTVSLSAFNGEVWISINIPATIVEAGSANIDFKQLFEISVHKSEVVIATDTKSIQIISGGMIYSFPVPDVANYTVVKEKSGGYVIPLQETVRGITLTEFVIGKKKNGYGEIQPLYCSEIPDLDYIRTGKTHKDIGGTYTHHIVASDGYRMAIYNTSYVLPGFSMNSTIANVLKAYSKIAIEKNINVSINPIDKGNDIHIWNTEIEIHYIAARYRPDIFGVMNNIFNVCITSTIPISAYLLNVMKRTNKIKITLTNTEMIFGNAEESGPKFNMAIPAKFKTTVPYGGFKICFKSIHLLEALNKIKKNRFTEVNFKFVSPLQAMFLDCPDMPNWTYVLMPSE